MRFRHEYKIEINQLDYLLLRQRLGQIMQHDRHADQQGKYKIRSLYFDNLYDKALREKIDGVNRREKFRLRFYNNDTSLVHLEKKSKINGLCNKQVEVISLQDARRLLAGDHSWMMASGRPLVQELYSKITFQQLRPKTVVEYEREAYIYAPGNVRVTIDKGVCGGPYTAAFFSPAMPLVPVEGTGLLLEVKYDNFLPALIADLIQLGGRRSEAYSKYAACRTYV